MEEVSTEDQFDAVGFRRVEFRGESDRVKETWCCGLRTQKCAVGSRKQPCY